MDLDLILRNARALVRPVADHAVPHDPIRVMLASALLAIHAKLTASESARQRAIADRDQAEARARQYLLDESEALAASEAAREALREALREYGFCAYCQGAYDGCIACVRTGLAQWARDALAADQTTARESAEETPVDVTPCYCSDRMSAGVPCLPGKCPNAPKPAPAQPPEPVEPSDEWLLGIYAPASSLRAVYRAGRASEAAAHEETKQELKLARASQRNVEAALKQTDVELARVRAELAAGREAMLKCIAYTDEGQPLDELARLVELECDSEYDLREQLQDQLIRANEELAKLRAQARARRVPTLMEFTAVLEAYCDSRSDEWFYAAVLRLFAVADATEPLVTSDNEPPVPLPEVLPAKTRWWTETLRRWTETLESARFDPKLAGGRYVFSDGTTLRPSVIDWSHYRAQQRAAEPTPGTVLGTARVVRGGKVEPREVEAPGLSETDNEPPRPLPDCPHGVGLCTSSCPCETTLRDRAQQRAAATPVEERPFIREAPPDSEIGQWRKASEAPFGTPCWALYELVRGKPDLYQMMRVLESNEVTVNWYTDDERGLMCAERLILGWLPLDALPPVPPTPGASDG